MSQNREQGRVRLRPGTVAVPSAPREGEKDTYRLEKLRPTETLSPPTVRWYKGYRGHGKADLLVAQLSQYLNSRKLTDTVCGLRMERRPKGEYYFFLTLETDYPGQLPESVEEALEDCRLLNMAAGGPYQLDDIQGMVSGELKIKALGQCLSYRQMRQELSDDPFGPDGKQEAESGAELAAQAEQLLYFLSSLGAGRWSTFRAAAHALGAGEQARTLARRLQLLGHLEVSQDGESWAVTAQSVLRVDTQCGDTLRFVCGARTDNLTGERDDQCGAPTRLRVTESPEGWPELHQPGCQLAAVLPTLAEYAASLETLGGVSTVGQTFAVLKGESFSKIAAPTQPGLYEITSASGRKVTALLEPRGTWRRGEWYGLRFLELHAAGLLLPARYDAATWQLALPADQRPPELYERALVLCSGLLPSRRGQWLVYVNVPPATAEEVLGRLSLPLQAGDLPQEELA